MNTYIERILKKIRKIGHVKGLSLSCDIYYDNLGDGHGRAFVVKVHDAFGINEHFRSNHVRKSLRDALKYVEGL